MSNPTEFAYLAGYFDGEGSISVLKEAKNEFLPNFILHIQIGSGDKKVLDRFSTAFGGPVREVYTPRVSASGRNQRRQIYKWSLSGTKAQNALRNMLPFMDTNKVVTGLLALEFKIQRHGNRCVPYGERCFREFVSQLSQAINQRVTISE